MLYTICFSSDNLDCFGNLVIYMHSLQVAFRLHKSIFPIRLIAFSILWSLMLRQLQTGLQSQLLDSLIPCCDSYIHCKMVWWLTLPTFYTNNKKCWEDLICYISIRIGQFKTIIKKHLPNKSFSSWHKKHHQFSSVQSLSCVRLFATPCTTVHQASLSITRVHPNPCSLSQWCNPTISFSFISFSSCFQPFPASGSFPMS